MTRIGDVTIERVVPKSGPGGGGGALSKETKDPIPPSVSLAKRDLDDGDTISVSEDLQVSICQSGVLKFSPPTVMYCGTNMKS